MKSVHKQRQLLFCVDGLCSIASGPNTRVLWLDRQVAVHSWESPSANGAMTRLKESDAVVQRQLADIQLALPTVESEDEKHRRRLDVEEHRCGGLEALLCGLHSRPVDHSSLVASVRGLLGQDVDHDLDVRLQAMFAAVCHFTTFFRSATSNVVENHSATICQDVSYIITSLLVV